LPLIENGEHGFTHLEHRHSAKRSSRSQSRGIENDSAQLPDHLAVSAPTSPTGQIRSEHHEPINGDESHQTPTRTIPTLEVVELESSSPLDDRIPQESEDEDGDNDLLEPGSNLPSLKIDQGHDTMPKDLSEVRIDIDFSGLHPTLLSAIRSAQPI